MSDFNSQGNILIDSEESVRLADFGMSVIADGTPCNYGSIHGGGAVRWRAPELMDPEVSEGDDTLRPTSRSDVYAFACVCIEVCVYAYLVGNPRLIALQLYTLQKPFPECLRDPQVICKVMKDIRPPKPVLPEGREISDDIWSLISSSWTRRPDTRPSAATIVKTLQEIRFRDKLLNQSDSIPLERNKRTLASSSNVSVAGDIPLTFETSPSKRRKRGSGEGHTSPSPRRRSGRQKAAAQSIQAQENLSSDGSNVAGPSAREQTPLLRPGPSPAEVEKAENFVVEVTNHFGCGQ